MAFDHIETTDRGHQVVGKTRTGRVARIGVLGGANGPRFDVQVEPLEGCTDFDAAMDIELSRVMAEADVISGKLRSAYGDDPGSFPAEELLRGAASVLDRREVEPELIEALLGMTEARPAL